MYFRLMGKLIRVPTSNLAPVGAMNLIVILYGFKSQYIKTCLHGHMARFSLIRCLLPIQTILRGIGEPVTIPVQDANIAPQWIDLMWPELEGQSGAKSEKETRTVGSRSTVLVVSDNCRLVLFMINRMFLQILQPVKTINKSQRTGGHNIRIRSAT